MRPKPALWILLATVMLSVPRICAGTISVAWDPVPGQDAVGYRVYWGTVPGSYDQARDVGHETEVTLWGLADCTVYYVGVKAHDAAGRESAFFVSEISGLPKPRVSAVTPKKIEPGPDRTIVIRGANFRPGATVRFRNPEITLNSSSVGSCGEIRASVRVRGAATLAPAGVQVINTELASGAPEPVFALNATQR